MENEMTKTKFDMKQYVTDKVIGALESGVTEWKKPWKNVAAHGAPFNGKSGKAYRGINVWLLGMEGRTSPEWRTFKQWKELDANVRKGESGTKIVFWKKIEKTDQDENGDDVYRSFMFCKHFTVFNAEQVDGYEMPTLEPIEFKAHEVDTYIANTNADIRNGGNRAFYSPSGDFIGMPQREAFNCDVSWYGTLLHELTHWTGSSKRCDRDFSGRFGDEAYAFEELVAELGAAMLCASNGIESFTDDQHAAYIGSWLKVLKRDKGAVFTAASKAQAAVGYLDSLQQEEKEMAA